MLYSCNHSNTVHYDWYAGCLYMNTHAEIMKDKALDIHVGLVYAVVIATIIKYNHYIQ